MNEGQGTLLVTGGAGFIGSAVARLAVAESSWRVIVADKLTYAGSLETLDSIAQHPRFRFERIDIARPREVDEVIERYRPNAVMHLAAETHVDRSIDGPADFIRTNVVGTLILLERLREYWSGLNSEGRAQFRFLHVSTDEVYGALGPDGDAFNERTPYSPRSPYAASKAASDHFVRAWHHTYGLPVLISNCGNNYGPYQFPEKLIPLTIVNALERQPISVYGNGLNIRDWIYVDDHARALLTILERGQVGETYNVGAKCQRNNLSVVHLICELLDKRRPRSDGLPHAAAIRFVDDRPGHDWRYAIDPSRIMAELGWRPLETFEAGLSRTIDFYLENEAWWRRVRTKIYDGRRLGKPSFVRPLSVGAS